MATGAIQVYGVSRIFSKCPIFGVSKMTSAGPNHLTAEEVGTFAVYARTSEKTSKCSPTMTKCRMVYLLHMYYANALVT